MRTPYNLLLTALSLLAASDCAQAMSRSLDLGFRYDAGQKTCLNRYGIPGHSPGYLGECGDLRRTQLTASDFILQPGSYRGILLGGLDLKNACAESTDLTGADLSGSDLSGADFKGALLRDAVLQNANLSHADLRSADLRGVDLAQWNGSGARFDEKTVWPLDCRQALARGFAWAGADEWACDSRPPRSLPLSNLFRSTHPGILAVIRGDESQVRLYHEDGLRIEPLSPLLSEEQKNEVLCAIRLQSCLADRGSLLRQWSLIGLPSFTFQTGIELFHGPLSEAERLGRLRIAGGFKVVSTETAQTVEADPALRKDLLRELSSAQVSGGNPALLGHLPIAWRSLLADSNMIEVAPQWLKLDQEGLTFKCMEAKSANSQQVVEEQCLLVLDYIRPPFAASGWAEEWVQGMVRASQNQTALVSLRLNSSTYAALGTHLRLDLPVYNMDLHALDGRWIGKRRRN